MHDLVAIDGDYLEIDSQIEEYRATNWSKFDNQLKGWAIAYANHYDHRLACKQVDMAEHMGIGLTRDPLVQALVSDLIEQKRLRTNITEDMVSTMWIKVLPKLMGEEEVQMVDNTGNAFKEKKFFASETVSALKEISKSTKFYAEGSGQGGINITQIAIKATMSVQEASTIYRDMMNGNG